MKINKIILENIRSYQNEQIDFKQGSTLLSGEIGSGKSSILLALDFALFGLRSGSLPGDSLLRKGSQKGSVIVNLELDNQNITITRILKKSNNSVVQEPGSIVINEKKEDVSPIELKERVLHLLNYPKELLTKNKSLIYRYTVYTPQEEMKYILFVEKEHRLEILRKVFGIDKYKRISDNTKIVTQHIKGLRKELAGRSFDLEEKKEVNEKKKEELRRLNEDILIRTEVITKLMKDSELKNHEIETKEKEIEKIKQSRNQEEIVEIKIETINQRRERIKEELTIIEQDLKDLKANLKEVTEINIPSIREKEYFLQQLHPILGEKNAQLGALKNKVATAEDIKEKISSMENCPLCKQQVKHEHKTAVIQNEGVKIKKAKEEIKNIEREIKNIENNKKKIEEEINSIRAQELSQETAKLKKKILQEKQLQQQILEKEYSKNKEEENNLIIQRKALQEELLDYENRENELIVLKKAKEQYQEEKRTQELEKRSKETEKLAIEKQQTELQEEIQKKQKDKELLLYWTKMQSWLEGTFITLIESIEQQILYKVHNDFNVLFKKWFEMLIKEDNLLVDLDTEFTPLLEQNGHIIEYGYLSGGEKTAIALAYRLALNQVVNQLMSVIKTKDLLILDEPTDGFSDPQIERIRDILKEINIHQVIIVSHEKKIESFVDHVIAIKKDDHVSRVFLP